MIPHDFMTMHAAKAVEYLIAVGYLLLFIPFWKYVNATPRRLPVHAHAPRRVATAADWFKLPEGLFFHPGHAWLRLDGTDTVTVGFDEFAGKLVGTPAGMQLPAAGTLLTQGEEAWSLVVDGKTVPMLSPVTGKVTEVNGAVLFSPNVAGESPYENGWLLKVKASSLGANVKQLFSGSLARSWMREATAALHSSFAPSLGAVYEDGGAMVDGVARALDPDNWDQVARRFLLTEEGGSNA